MGTLKLTPVERFTDADFAELPDDGKKWELIDGDLALTPPAGTFHQSISVRLCRVLAAGIMDTGAGFVFTAPFSARLSKFDVVEPDLLVVKRSRKRLITERWLDGPPDLAVEILSKSTGRFDRSTKRALYERSKVPEYWIIDPESKSIEVLVLTRGKYNQHAVFKGRSIARSNAFPEIEVRLTELFAPL